MAVCEQKCHRPRSSKPLSPRLLSRPRCRPDLALSGSPAGLRPSVPGPRVGTPRGPANVTAGPGQTPGANASPHTGSERGQTSDQHHHGNATNSARACAATWLPVPASQACLVAWPPWPMLPLLQETLALLACTRHQEAGGGGQRGLHIHQIKLPPEQGAHLGGIGLVQAARFCFTRFLGARCLCHPGSRGHRLPALSRCAVM